MDGKNLREIRNLYRDQTTPVRIEGEHSDFKSTKRAVRLGCVISPDLFHLYSEIILRNLGDISGLKINEENLNNLKYADGIVFIAESGEHFQKLLDSVVLESKRMSLSLNVKKTECTVISKKSSGALSEVSKRIAIAKDTFQKMKPTLANRNISLSLNVKKTECTVISKKSSGALSETHIPTWRHFVYSMKLKFGAIWPQRELTELSSSTIIPSLDRV
ncbi:endonuclease-reverse transcriptase [Plakobranchus ocellatus]|uniref:Endonuclease-reverse transcriptase n=1 Tax=Plakobranchus ocellatus TaxID=259542 RepID=A0AAV4DTD9_9GAST|nr:endonuclease-reverse transcriptase [Plakobranchus ocellatus]